MAEIHDVDDVLVSDARRTPRLLQETSYQIRPARQLGRQHLERELLFDHDVLGQVDRAHAALAQFAKNSVAVRDQL